MRHRYAILSLVLLALPTLAQPDGDPWAEVPPLPRSCYRENDEFEGKAYAAAEALEQEKMRQVEINDALSEQYRNVDIMEQQQRMMVFMMEHPQDAQRVMEAMQQGSLAAQEQMPEMSERSARIESELADLSEAYQAALQQNIGPIEQRRQALMNSAEWCTPGSLVEVAEINKEENRAYESLCASWWQDGGAFHAWFAEFKQFQIESAAQQDEQLAGTRLNYEMAGLPADQYRGTYHLSAPIDYLRRANQVFMKRNFAPVSEDPIEVCRDGHG